MPSRFETTFSGRTVINIQSEFAILRLPSSSCLVASDKAVGRSPCSTHRT
jgi:hypothetical protein